jgi:hypothetical protein
MTNYANRSSKCDAKGKRKVGASGPPPAPIPVPAPIPAGSVGMTVAAAANVGVAPSVGGFPPIGKSVPSSTGTEVAIVPPKRRRITKQGILYC